VEKRVSGGRGVSGLIFLGPRIPRKERRYSYICSRNTFFDV